LLFRGELCVERQLRHAHDSIARRANFVAHVGKELALRAAGGFRCFLRLPHGLFRAFAHRNVLIDRHGAYQLGVHEQPDGVQLNIHQGSIVSPAARQENGRLIAAALQRYRARFQQRVAVLQQGFRGFSQDFLARVLKKEFKGGIAQLHLLFGISDHNGERAIFDQSVQVCCPFFDSFLQSIVSFL